MGTKICGSWRMMALALAVPAASHCGRDTGYVYKVQPVQQADVVGTQPDFAVTRASYNSLTWYFPCPSEVSTPPASTAKDPVLVGAGPFSMPRERLVGTNIIYKGHVCGARVYDRDVVVAVDISGSMSWNDPETAGTCNRFKALDAFLGTLPTGSTMGVVLFDDTLGPVSTKLFSTPTDLYADLTTQAGAGTKIQDVVCDAGGQSDFNLAIATAHTLLATGRGNATEKELVFISDGDATNIATTTAVAAATDMSTNGVAVSTGEKIKASVAALTITDQTSNPNPAIIFPAIVSKDLAGNPLVSTVDQPTPVANALAGFAHNVWQGGSLAYQVTGAAAWTTLDLTPQITGTDFLLAQPALAIDGRQSGFSVKVGYADTHGNQVNLTGSLVWND